MSKHDAPEAVLALSKDLIESYADHVRICIDASRTSKGRVISVAIQKQTIETKQTELKLATQRVADHVSVAEEIAAIQLAIMLTASQLNSNFATDSVQYVASTMNTQRLDRICCMLQEIYEAQTEPRKRSPGCDSSMPCRH